MTKINDLWLRRQYLKYNRLYFHNELPQNLEVCFKRSHEEYAGCTYFDPENGQPTAILIDYELKKYPKYAKCVLLHEQCHVAIGNKEKAYHGPMFQKERKRLVDSGAFTTLL